MSTLLNIRKATTADIPFLAKIEYEASLPPLNHCFWEDLQEGTGTTALQFIEAELKTDNVAVLPEARGQGFGKVLLKALLEEGRSQQHEFPGITKFGLRLN